MEHLKWSIVFRLGKEKWIEFLMYVENRILQEALICGRLYFLIVFHRSDNMHSHIVLWWKRFPCRTGPVFYFQDVVYTQTLDYKQDDRDRFLCHKKIHLDIWMSFSKILRGTMEFGIK